LLSFYASAAIAAFDRSALSRHMAQPETDQQTASETAKATRALVAQHRNESMKLQCASIHCECIACIAIELKCNGCNYEVDL